MIDLKEIRKYFPIYENHPNLIYLDTGATALKPKMVIDKMNEYYFSYGVNIHRGVYELSYHATEEYDVARTKVANFINAKFEEVIFTKNASDSLNLACLTYGKVNLNEGDVVLTSELEHHSSVLPWMKLCEEKKAILRYIPLNKEGRITIENVLKVMDDKVKVVALTYVSNVMGYVSPIKEIIRIAHEHNAIVVVDAAQAVSHIKIDVKDLDCDFLGFSGHKMMGPTGIGVLYGKAKILNKLQPLYYGGDMNEEVDLDNVEVKDIPYRFETGTPAIAEAIGLGMAIDFINKIGIDSIKQYTSSLHQYALDKLNTLKGITIYNKTSEAPIIAFNINNVHPHDAATVYDEKEIALRAGHHCAQLITKWLKCIGTLRCCIYIYNTREDIDKFVETTAEAVSFFERFGD